MNLLPQTFKKNLSFKLKIINTVFPTQIQFAVNEL